MLMTYLRNIMERVMSMFLVLTNIRQGQKAIMAQLEDVQARLDSLTTTVSAISPTLASISTGIAGVAADIDALKAQIGAGTPGITPEEADGVVAQLDAISGKATEAVAGLQAAADALSALDAAQ